MNPSVTFYVLTFWIFLIVLTFLIVLNFLIFLTFLIFYDRISLMKPFWIFRDDMIFSYFSYFYVL